jgi:hypothetical protein
MSEAQPILFRKKRLQAYRGRGRLYSWLRAHRTKIAAGLLLAPPRSLAALKTALLCA